MRICILILGCKGLSNRYGNGQNDYSSWVIFLFHNGTQFCTLLQKELNCYNFILCFTGLKKIGTTLL